MDIAGVCDAVEENFQMLFISNAALERLRKKKEWTGII